MASGETGRGGKPLSLQLAESTTWGPKPLSRKVPNTGKRSRATNRARSGRPAASTRGCLFGKSSGMTGETVGRLLAAGNVAELFEWGSQVIKLYRSAAAKPTVFREAAIHAAVEALGLPVPAVWGVEQIGDRWGIVFARVTGPTFAAQIQERPAKIPQYLDILARLHARIHALPADRLGSLKVRIATNIARTELLGEPRKQILLGRLAEMPDGDRLCHRDFHPKNVLGEPAEPVVIDWPDACRGDPAADACRSYLLLKHNAEDIAEPYLDAWCRISSVAPARVADWLPYVAAARLAEDIPNEVDRLLKIAHS
jgi:hypothetical protein